MIQLTLEIDSKNDTRNATDVIQLTLEVESILSVIF